MEKILKDEYNPGGIGRVKPHNYYDAPYVGPSAREDAISQTAYHSDVRINPNVTHRKPDVWKMSHYNMRGHSMTRPVKEEKK